MKTSILIFTGILISVLLIANGLTGNLNHNKKSITLVPASVVEGDTLAIVDLPVVIINGNK